MTQTLPDAINDYGPALAADPEIGVIVTLNGAYFNVWVGSRDRWENAEAFDATSRLHDDAENVDPFNTLAGVTLNEAQEAAEKVLEFFTEV